MLHPGIRATVIGKRKTGFVPFLRVELLWFHTEFLQNVDIGLPMLLYLTFDFEDQQSALQTLLM